MAPRVKRPLSATASSLSADAREWRPPVPAPPVIKRKYTKKATATQEPQNPPKEESVKPKRTYTKKVAVAVAVAAAVEVAAAVAAQAPVPPPAGV